MTREIVSVGGEEMARRLLDSLVEIGEKRKRKREIEKNRSFNN